MKTPEEVAQAKLDEYAIKDHWRRDGERIRKLIAEAIEEDRARVYADGLWQIKHLGEPYNNREYTRGQVELLAVLTGDGYLGDTIDKIYEQLGIDPI